MAISSPWFKKGKSSTGRVGLAVGPDGLAVAAVNAEGIVEYCQFHDPLGDSANILSELVVEQGWGKMPCSIVLHPVYYQLLLTERPAVKDVELSSAVRWKVKELLDFPVEEAAIEHFLLPEDAYRGKKKMVYAAALRKTALQSLVEPVKASGLLIDRIEVSELALHNVVSRLPHEGGGIAMMQLHAGEGFINLVEDGAIYLTRRLDIGLDKFSTTGNNTAFFDSLFLEIQRSLDYYESQLGKGIITQLFYSPGLAETNDIGEFLSAQLGLNVSKLDLAELEAVSKSALDLEGNEQLIRSASAIGAALGTYTLPEGLRAAS
jgi:MSHA biogenesis protein MshI